MASEQAMAPCARPWCLALPKSALPMLQARAGDDNKGKHKLGFAWHARFSAPGMLTLM